MSQLSDYVAVHGPVIDVGGRKLTVSEIDTEMRVASFKGPRATFTGVRCLNARVLGDADAEVWSVLGGGRGRTVVEFAVSKGQIKALRK